MVGGVDAQRDRAEAARVARLATVGADGRPHLVPICFALVGEVLYTAVDGKPKRSRRLRRVANLQATGHASILIDGYDENWSRLWWIRLDGIGRVVDDDAERDRALAALRAKYPQYATDPPDGPVLAIDIRRRSGWRAS